MCMVQVHLVEPRFNRLTVFDGRYPHGVRPVEGTRDPLKARLVLHGWFTDPTPFFEGVLLLPCDQAQMCRILSVPVGSRMRRCMRVVPACQRLPRGL